MKRLISSELPPPRQFNRQLTECWSALQGGKTIAVYHALAEVTGSVKTAVMLSQLLYWTRIVREMPDHPTRDGWIYKTVAQLEAETGLTAAEQRTCKHKLFALNILESKRTGMGAKQAFRINPDALGKAICNHFGYDHSEYRDTEKSLIDWMDNRSLFCRRYLSKRFAYHRDLVDVTGCIPSAIMLSQMLHESVVYNSRNQAVGQRSFTTHSIGGWQKNLCLPYKTQLRVRKKLKSLGLITEKHFFASRRIFTLVSGKNIITALFRLRKKQGLKSSEIYDAPVSSTSAQIHTKSLISPRMRKRAVSECEKGHNYLNQCVMQNANFLDEPVEMENSDLLKGKIKSSQNGELSPAETENTDTLKGQIIIDKNYNKFPKGNNYNIDTDETGLKDTEQGILDNVVVGAVNFDELVYPKQLAGSIMRNSVRNLFNTMLPDATTETVQLILDELAGYSKPVNRPLGLLQVLIRLQSKGELTCTNAPQVQQKRLERERWNEQRQQDLNPQPIIPNNMDSPARNQVLEKLKTIR